MTQRKQPRRFVFHISDMLGQVNKPPTTTICLAVSLNISTTSLLNDIQSTFVPVIPLLNIGLWTRLDWLLARNPPDSGLGWPARADDSHLWLTFDLVSVYHAPRYQAWHIFRTFPLTEASSVKYLGALLRYCEDVEHYIALKARCSRLKHKQQALVRTFHSTPRASEHKPNIG